MRIGFTISGFLALFACAAFGQTGAATATDKTFPLAGGEPPQAMQEMANIVRSVAEISHVTANFGQASITVRATADQMAMAAWVIGELDQPTKAANLTYLPPGGGDDIVRIFYLTHAGNPQQLQEMVNVIRSTAEIQQVMIYNSSSAVVLRGKMAPASLAEWVIKGLDLAPGQHPPFAQTAVTFAPGELTQIFYLNRKETAAQCQEIVNVIRSIGEIQRLTAYNATQAITMRGTAVQAAVAAWLIGELDKPVPPAALENSNTMQGTADGAIRVFYLPGIPTLEAFQQLVNQIRTAAQLQRIAVAYNTVKAVALRGTAAQVALAEKVIKERTKL